MTEQIKEKHFYNNENGFLQSWVNNYAQFNLFYSDIFFFLCMLYNRWLYLFFEVIILEEYQFSHLIYSTMARLTRVHAKMYNPIWLML